MTTSNKPGPSHNNQLGSSFRDPAGFIYKSPKGELFRQINPVGFDDFRALTDSSLYELLVKNRLLVAHNIVEDSSKKATGKIIIKPEMVRYISYPFEWSFSQLKDAALATLKIQKLALEHDVTLKDASAYNIQFSKGRPIFIDTLSFESYKQGEPWQAYRQFCQHFFAPLALMAYADLDLSQMLRVYIDGIPLGLTTKLLPRKARIKPSIYMHIVLHSKAQKAKASEHKKPTRTIPKRNLLAIITNLEAAISKLKPLKSSTEWGEYYDNTNYTTSSADAKAKIIRQFIEPLAINSAMDMAGNNGRYSRVLNKAGIFTICNDIDPNAVESNYLYTKAHNEERMLPLLVNLVNPGGAIGWANNEREVITDRLQVDLIMALALVHHLAISNNLPFDSIAQYFSQFSPYLIIEFVPKTDSQVKKLLSTRRDIFSNYDEQAFKNAFASRYNLIDEKIISGSKRTLYLFKRK